MVNDIRKSRSRSAAEKIIKRTMYGFRYAVWFLAAFLMLWPEPIFETHLDKLGRCAGGVPGSSVMDANFVYVGTAFLLFNLLWIILADLFGMKPKRFAEWRVTLQFLMIPLGLSAGLAWRTAVGVTTGGECNQESAPAVIGMHWRPEIRAATGLDSVFGIDLTIPRIKTYIVFKAFPMGQCKVREHLPHYGNLYAVNEPARICRDHLQDILPGNTAPFA